jgi:acetyl esterase/lipase
MLISSKTIIQQKSTFMKKYVALISLILLTFILLYSSVSGQGKSLQYKTLTKISYYTENRSDYMKDRCVLDLYYPENASNYLTVVWFHGGGLTSGEKFIPEALKEQGIAVVAVNYRLYPKVKCPGYIEDAAAAIAWVFRNVEHYGGSAKKIVVSGHSAGGYLTLMAGLDKRWLAKHNIDADSIVCLVPFSGHTITHKAIREERGIPDKQPVVDEFAPLFHVRADAPPLHLITGDRELEMLGRYEENAYLWRMMKVAGHQQTYLYELDGYDHGGMAGPGFGILLKILKQYK